MTLRLLTPVEARAGHADGKSPHVPDSYPLSLNTLTSWAATRRPAATR